MINVFSRYQRDSSGASHSSVRSFKARLYLTEKKRLKIVGWYFKDTMLKKNDGWCRERRAISPDTESRPISRRRSRQLSDTPYPGTERVARANCRNVDSISESITFYEIIRRRKNCRAVSWAVCRKIDDMKMRPLFRPVSKEREKNASAVPSLTE